MPPPPPSLPPPLPLAFSPHICIRQSPDLVELFATTGLPPIHDVLQSFVPLPAIQTRTIALTNVTHPNFMLRFSDLNDIEAACREDEEARAGRTIDWISERVQRRCARWVEESIVEDDMSSGRDTGRRRTPWWEELRRCVEGDNVPTKSEGWNHPTAVIVAVSTTAPNPLQAITNLYSRPLDMPSFIDTAHLKYTLIIHPSNSRLNDEEAMALLNAVKKQFGLNTYLLRLSLPSPPPPPVPVSQRLPRLPPIPISDNDSRTLPPPALRFTEPVTPLPQDNPPLNTTNSIQLAQSDIDQTAKFVREFVTTSLVPWMERCVVEWNEAYSSTRRLPSRLFSTTRRLFGTSSPAPPVTAPATPTGFGHGHTASTASIASLNGSVNGISVVGVGGIPSQQRRLAEFATILGDLKLAISLWEGLRKESKGLVGSDVLPLLLAPSPALQLHAQSALTAVATSLGAGAASAIAQVRSLALAVRWEIGINPADFLGPALEGDRWLVWAAADAEESPAALILSHAGLLSLRRGCKRRAAMWFVIAARRLEKCGIKPLTMYFLRKAHQLYSLDPGLEKSLSPLFDQSQEWAMQGGQKRRMDGILTSVEHSLGRLLYTNGDTEVAVKYFLSLLRGSPSSSSVSMDGALVKSAEEQSEDKILIEDFRVALQHLKSTAGEGTLLPDLKLPFTFSQPKETKVRLKSDLGLDTQESWQKREESWRTFWRQSGTKDVLESTSKAYTGEHFWVDIVLENPLDVAVTLANLSVILSGTSGNDDVSAFTDVETIEEVYLNALEKRTVPISIKSSKPSTLSITNITYSFLSLLPVSESLSVRGRRLQETARQRQGKEYAPDHILKVQVDQSDRRLEAAFVQDELHGKDTMVALHGERVEMVVRVINTGTSDIGELWVVKDDECVLWLGGSGSGASEGISGTQGSDKQLLATSNSVSLSEPIRIAVDKYHTSPALAPGETAEIPLVFHADTPGGGLLSLLFVFRQTDNQPFRSVRISRVYDVVPLFNVAVRAKPARKSEYPYMLEMQVQHVGAVGHELQLTEVASVSPSWSTSAMAASFLGPVQPYQSSRFFLRAHRHESESSRKAEKETVEFVRRKIKDVLQGNTLEPSDPPPLELAVSTIHKRDESYFAEAGMKELVHQDRCTYALRTLGVQHKYIPRTTYRHIFPLYHPLSVDLVLFWETSPTAPPSTQRNDAGTSTPNNRLTGSRSGHLLIPGLFLGVGDGALRDIIAEADGTAIASTSSTSTSTSTSEKEKEKKKRPKRSMFAETRREREEVVEAVRRCEWNAEGDPVVVGVSVGKGGKGSEVGWDFVKGPCTIPVTFTLRNHSSRSDVEFCLKLGSENGPSSSNSTSNPTTSTSLLPPTYFGTLSHRGRLAPYEAKEVEVGMWVGREGRYVVAGWSVESVVLDAESEAKAESDGAQANSESPDDEKKGKEKARYVQGLGLEEAMSGLSGMVPSVTVYQVPRASVVSAGP